MSSTGVTRRNVRTLTADVLKSSEIEGQKLDAEQVRSSIARRLGMDIGAPKPADRHVEGVVEMMLDATRHSDRPLTEERLLDWHASLFPTGRSGMTKIRTGAWRDDKTRPMQMVCGPIGKEHVHFEAPKASRVPREMKAFLKWFESGKPMDAVLKAGFAHLWFVTKHPFDDGNGRVARAIDGAQEILSAVLRKSQFWERIKDLQINERQRLIINRLLDGFEGKLTSSKYATLAKCSQDTAHRDILALVDHGVLVRNPKGGRSTSYSLAPAG